MIGIFNHSQTHQSTISKISSWVPRKMKKDSWVCTIITQISLCFALFLVLQIGQTQKPVSRTLSGSRDALDLYFISLRAGFRPLQEQTRLVKRIEKVIKAYKARFVINISELGEDDALNQIATRYFRSFNVSWYATRSSKVDGAPYFLRQVKAPNGNTLDVFFVDTGLFQDTSSVRTNEQLNWLQRALESSDANWRIVAGVHPMTACNRTDQAEIKETLHHLFLKTGVNAYISGQACSDRSREDDGMDIKGSVAKGPYFMATNQSLNFSNSYREHEFLLHRVSSLEMVTYFVTITGEVVHTVSIRQLGREAM